MSPLVSVATGFTGVTEIVGVPMEIVAKIVGVPAEVVGCGCGCLHRSW